MHAAAHIYSARLCTLHNAFSDHAGKNLNIELCFHRLIFDLGIAMDSPTQWPKILNFLVCYLSQFVQSDLLRPPALQQHSAEPRFSERSRARTDHKRRGR